MSDVLLYRLKENRDVILKDLEADEVLDYLYQEDVLDGDKYEEVREQGPRKKQAALLLSYVERESTAIEKMITALERSSQRHLARVLQEPLENEITLSKGIAQTLRNTLGDCYPMTHNPCGYAVIINNVKFDERTKMLRRDGSEKDVKNAKKLFKYLQFDVVTHENKTADEILHIVREYSMEDHSNFDCFVLFLMSHGFPHGIYGVDGKEMHLDEIRYYLKPDKCLANKPKLIFVQACRGGAADKGFVLLDSPDPEQRNRPDPEQRNRPDPEQRNRPDPEQRNRPDPEQRNRPDSEQRNRPDPEQRNRPDPEQRNRPDPEQRNRPDPEQRNRPTQEVSEPPATSPSNVDVRPSQNDQPSQNDLPSSKQHIPQNADTFTAYASSANSAAVRNAARGCWFVRHLYNVMVKYAKTEDLTSMMLKITKQVSEQKAIKENEVWMQCPEIVSNLRAKVFFKPKGAPPELLSS